MDESEASEGLRGRISSRGEEALGELGEFLLENPWLHQALQVALEARDRATEASANAMRGLNVPAASEVDRLGRRLRALSERLEAVEDSLDQLTRELAELRKDSSSARGYEPPRG
ncbi:MAG: hypothetical protein M3O25_06865 [Actinomycetota bacterium]|nr:hypothetical protein [Actinomycetota bacterium]